MARKRTKIVAVATTRRRRNRNRRARAVTTVIPAAAVPTRRPRQRRNRRRGGVLAEIGGTVGGILGPATARLGRAIGGGIGRIFGSGQYTINSGVRQNTLAGNTPPSFGSLTASTRIRHREFIGDISGSTNFTVHRYPIAPGIAQLFPWLSRLAANYEQYQVRGLVVEFKSTSATALNSTNTALGVVGLVTQYDADEPAFTSKQEAENYVGCQTTSPSSSMLHFVECAPGQNPLVKLYIRNGTLSADQDIKFYDMGVVTLFTTGMQAAAVIGELWVSYDIEFLKPKMPSGGQGSLALLDKYSMPSVGQNNIYLSGKVSGATTNPAVSGVGTYIINNTLYFPPQVQNGNYLVIITASRNTSGGAATGSVLWDGVSTPTAPLSFGPNCLNNNTLPSMAFGTAIAGQNEMSAWFSFNYNSSNTVGSFVFSGFNLNGSGTSTWDVDVVVAAWPGLPSTITRQMLRDMYDDLKTQFLQLKRQHGFIEAEEEEALSKRKETTEIIQH